MSKALRVLVVTNMWPHDDDPSHGSFVQEQAESLRPLGVDYNVVFMNGPQSRMNYLRGVPEVRRRLRAEQYDLIHAHFGLSGWVARFQLTAPLVVTFHGDDLLGKFRFDGSITPLGRLFQATSRILAPMVRAVIVQSREMERKVRYSKVRVIPCGIDLDLFQPTDPSRERQKLGLDLRKKYVVFAYNPAEQRKRYDLVQKAVAIAQQKGQNLEILHVKGRPHQVIPSYLNAADAVVVASEAEGGPLITKEAMAVNLPVISVDVGDVRELFGASAGNYIVPRSADAIADKLVEVCQRGGRSCGRERLGPFSMQATAQKVLEVYRNVLARP